jgi:hypothetical protein
MLGHNSFFRRIQHSAHIKVENCRANNLAQDALGYWITDVTLDSQVSDRPGMGARLFDGARKVLLIDSVDNRADAFDWRTPIINYLRNPSVRTDRNIRRTTFKYVLMSNELYR